MKHEHQFRHILLFEVHEIEEYLNQHRLVLDERWTIMENAIAAIIGYGNPTPTNIVLKGRETLLDYFNHDWVDDWMNDIVKEIISLYGQHIQKILFFISSQFPTSHLLEIYDLSISNGILFLWMFEDTNPYLTSRFNYYAQKTHVNQF